ncbi:MAG: TrkH family potassium uptake protein [Clostridia bacterium]|nr:TrkH family potassium uptake protein [Clostridia bacterium]
MNRRMVLYMVGRILQIEALLFLLPLVCALCYGEGSVALSFLICAALSFAAGSLLTLARRAKTSRTLYAREGFVIVTLAWLSMSALGALPFVIEGAIPSFVDAFFETVSGFTTTGASILTDVEAMAHGLLFWRSFTHWVGGMGVLVFVMAILPNEGGGRSIHIMRAEMPGPIIGKLVPKIRDTAKILYLIYVAMTAAEVILLLFGGMNLFESLVHTFGTAGTGGFGCKADSIAGYSPYCQWVICVFMFLFGVNFNVYYLLLLGKLRSVFKSSELWCYTAIAVGVTAVVAVNISSLYSSVSEALRHAAFQVSSVMTTTGYATTDFNLWPGLSKTLLVLLMFIGASAGSTGGGLKVSRVVLTFKLIRRELQKLVHPRSVSAVKLEGKKVEEQTLSNTAVYVMVYFVLFFVILILVSLDPIDFESAFTATAACFNNIGPGLASVGPAANYAHLSAFAKLVLSAAMLLGRLEIFPILVACSVSTWKKR